MEKEPPLIAGPELTLSNFLAWQSKLDLDQINSLIMLSLITLLGILGLVHRHLGGDGYLFPQSAASPSQDNSLLKVLSSLNNTGGGGGDLGGLLNMVGGLLKNVDPAFLLGMLSNLMGVAKPRGEEVQKE